MKNEMCTSSERKFIVMSPVSGKAVQNWSFAGTTAHPVLFQPGMGNEVP